MLFRCLLAIALAAVVATPAAQSDVDALMSRVLARRDDNWKKLQQYTLQETETLQVTALAVLRIYGFEREYLWFPRAGFFVRSPLTADGVTIGEDQRRREEDRWLRRSQNRERRQAERTPGAAPSEDRGLGPGNLVPTAAVEDVILQSFEPDFIKSANFLRFKFDAGQYALAGRERVLDRDVLRIEYYPTLLFTDDNERQRRDGRARAGSRDAAADEARRQREDDFEARMNKVSLVTLWIDPAAHQILRYDFRFQDLDFLPGGSIVRVDTVRATMQMGEPFPGVWLPASLDMRFRMSSAAGPLEARYDVAYTDYRLPTTGARIVP
jgi:hypothetical protein